MAAIFPGKFTRDNGAAPMSKTGELTVAGETWLAALKGLSPKQLAAGMSACLSRALQWPPNPAAFRAMCLGLPSRIEVAQQMLPGRDRSGFTVLVRSLLDLHTYNGADGAQQERMLGAAYELAMQRVSQGEPLPPPLLSLPEPRPTAPVVMDRSSAAAAMARAAAELGFASSADVGIPPLETGR